VLTEGITMARTRKEGQAKNAGKTAQEPKKMEEAQEVSQEPEAAEEAQEVSQEPERVSGVKTTEEEATAIAAQVEEMGAEVNEAGEIVITKPETDMFAKLPNPCVYCGPSVKGVARQYTTYQGGIPDAMRKFIKEHPAALRLIVSTGKFQAMRKRLETRGTPEEKLYKALKDFAMTASSGHAKLNSERPLDGAVAES